MVVAVAAAAAVVCVRACVRACVVCVYVVGITVRRVVLCDDGSRWAHQVCRLGLVQPVHGLLPLRMVVRQRRSEDLRELLRHASHRRCCT